MVRTYGLLAWTWTRASLQYPFALVLLSLGSMLSVSLDLAALAILFTRLPVLGGFTPGEAMFLYGTSQISFGLSDALFGMTDRLGQHIKAGSLDTMMVRPVSPLIQLATEDFSPRKLSRLLPASAVLAWSVTRVELSALDLLLTAVMVAVGTVIFSAVWVLAASVQFVLVDGHQAAKAVTWGGGFMTQYPMSLYGRDFVRGITFVMPLAFVNWQPSLYLLGHPDPLGLPAAFRFGSPLVALVLCAAATLAWRAGLRHYRSTGS
ncbi:MAG: ABC-2 family transporter protein [Streptosporangiaceae bacterium]